MLISVPGYIDSLGDCQARDDIKNSIGMCKAESQQFYIIRVALHRNKREQIHMVDNCTNFIQLAKSIYGIGFSSLEELSK